MTVAAKLLWLNAVVLEPAFFGSVTVHVRPVKATEKELEGADPPCSIGTDSSGGMYNPVSIPPKSTLPVPDCTSFNQRLKV